MSRVRNTQAGNEKLEDNKRRARKVIKVFDQANPDTTPALQFSTPFEILLAPILVAQCTDELVNSVNTKLWKKFRTPDSGPVSIEAPESRTSLPLPFFGTRLGLFHPAVLS